MRKFKRRQPHGLTFRLLVILAGALLLLAAFAPCANAALLRYYNFEAPLDPTYLVGLNSNPPAFELGGGLHGLQLHNTTGLPYPDGNTSVEAGLNVNIANGDPAPNMRSLGIHSSRDTQLNLDMAFPSPTGAYDITSVTMAIAANGNGYLFARVQMSSDGGVTFPTLISGPVGLPGGGGRVVTFNIIPGTTLNIPNLVLRINFTGGQSNGVDLQNQIDNIQINGTAVPEPATVAGGLLGVLGLCWHQRRRLIRSVRLRRT